MLPALVPTGPQAAGVAGGAYGGTATPDVPSVPERTITEAKVHEVSVVTFPAYAGADAGVRSLTDWYRSGEAATRPIIWMPARRREWLLLG